LKQQIREKKEQETKHKEEATNVNLQGVKNTMQSNIELIAKEK
jgi:hypothetical protein